MLKKTLVSITILAMILALASVSAVGAKGGKPTETPPPIPTEIPDTGDLYGDLYVILRDENGVPILNTETITVPESEEGDAYTVDVDCIQPIATDDLDLYDYDEATQIYSMVISTIPNHDPITIYPGEPFVPASYVDTAGDLVECELGLTADPNNTPTDPTDDEVIYDLTPFVQAVDFGRLNLGRAPEAVIAHGFDEAVNKMNSATEIDLDPAGRLMLLLDGEWKTIDAPAENLALYVKMMLDGHWFTLDTTPVEPGGGGGKGGGGNGGGGGPPPGDGPSTEPRPVLQCFDEDGNDTLLKDELDSLGFGGLCDGTDRDLTNPELQLAASLLAAAADKAGTFSLDMVIYINSVYGINQAGSLEGEVEGKNYFDFGGFSYDRGGIYGNRSSGGCSVGEIWVLQPVDEGYTTFTVVCVEILAYENSDHDPNVAGIHFTDMEEGYWTTLPPDASGNPVFEEYDFIDNVRGFAQSADDALQVIEYIHNYKIPEDLYAE